jgi:hypothetical protein
VLTAEEAAGWLCDSDVGGTFWRGDERGDALDEETDERLLLLEAMFAWLWLMEWILELELL